MAEGGRYERLPQEDPFGWGGNDDDNADQTGAFYPNGASTPAPTMQTEKHGLPELPKTPEDFLNEPPSLSTTTFAAKSEIDKEFPYADKSKIKYRMDRKGRTEVGLISPKKPYIRLLTEIPGKSGKYRINPSLPKEVLRALGKSSRQEIQEEIKKISDDISESKKAADDKKMPGFERNNARKRIDSLFNKRGDLERQLEFLEQGEITRDGGGQSISLETFQKNEERRIMSEEEFEKEKKELEQILNDENASTSERENARQEIDEINQELNAIENEREREAERLSFRDRLWEKIKAIFKKYGVTVTAIFLAAGATIASVVSVITNALKKVGTELGNGLKTIGAKAASALPGLIGAIVSFLFKAAGSAIGFLAEHTWLLILAVVAFLFQKLMKKN